MTATETDRVGEQAEGGERDEREDRGRALGGLLEGWRLDAVITLLATVLVAGVMLDFRSHVEGISFAEEGFFTPEHVLFYSMFLVIAGIIGGLTVANRRQGASWLAAVPAGYGVGVIGVLMFGLGGAFDFAWHQAFGFEEGVEGVTSPAHLLLAAGAVLYLTSPARATWRRESVTGGIRAIPATISLALGLTIAVLFVLFANPVSDAFPAGPATYEIMALGLASVIIYATVVVGAMLVLARRFDLPPGALTLLAVVPGVASAFPTGSFTLIAATVAMGVVADVLAQVARPTLDRPRSLRVFGALVPTAFAAAYMGTILAAHGITWPIHVWAGGVAYAGLAGLGLTYVIRPTTYWSET